MRILLDECVPARLKKAFPDHAVQTVTVDRNLETQNDLRKFRLGFILARVPNNRLEGFEPIFEQLNAAAAKVRRGEIIWVVSPELKS